MIVTPRPSIHREARKDGGRPRFLILHYTETKTFEEAEGYFTGRLPHPSGGRVSAHYLIGRDGAACQYVPDDERAWHAGVSFWQGIRDINSSSIGIELVHPGHGKADEGATREGERFPAIQLASLIMLARRLMREHGISPENVLGHSDIAPARKKDPGEFFPWEMLAAEKIGVWPQVNTHHYIAGAELLRSPELMRGALTDYGYDPAPPLDVVLTAFQRHFEPEVFGPPVTLPGTPTLETAARLVWLTEYKKAGI